MSNPRHPSIRKKAILLVGSTVCRCGQGLGDWIDGCVHGRLLLAVTETHDQTQVRYDRGQDDLKAGFVFSKISALPNPQSDQAGNPTFHDDALAEGLLSGLGLVIGAALLLQSVFGV